MQGERHNGIPLLPQLFGQLLILFLCGYADVEQQNTNPVYKSSSGIRLRSKRERITGKQQLAARGKVEGVLALELSGDSVVSGNGLEDRYVPQYITRDFTGCIQFFPASSARKNRPPNWCRGMFETSSRSSSRAIKSPHHALAAIGLALGEQGAFPVV